MKMKFSNKINIVNKRAKFDYSFLEKYEAGICLTGTEIKSIRVGHAGLTDAFCHFEKEALYIKNMHVLEYELGTHYNHEARRERKLLLRKKELTKLLRRVTEKGLTIVPYRLYISERGFAKLEIMLAEGKKTFDKRDSIKERDTKRELDRVKKIHS